MNSPSAGKIRIFYGGRGIKGLNGVAQKKRGLSWGLNGCLSWGLSFESHFLLLGEDEGFWHSLKVEASWRMERVRASERVFSVSIFATSGCLPTSRYLF